MLEAIDYSNRRGVMVPLLSQIHALMAENAKKDKLSGILPPENIILWKQRMKKELVDIKRRWLLAMDTGQGLSLGLGLVAGLLFYRYGDTGKLYIDELQVAWAFRNDEKVIFLLLDKFQNDINALACMIYASARIKIDYNDELLAAVGTVKQRDEGWERLGGFSEAIDILKSRYGRR